MLDLAGLVFGFNILQLFTFKLKTIKTILNKSLLPPLKIYEYALLQTQHNVNNFFHGSIDFLWQEVIKVRHTVQTLYKFYHQY